MERMTLTTLFYPLPVQFRPTLSYAEHLYETGPSCEKDRPELYYSRLFTTHTIHTCTHTHAEDTVINALHPLAPQLLHLYLDNIVLGTLFVYIHPQASY